MDAIRGKMIEIIYNLAKESKDERVKLEASEYIMKYLNKAFENCDDKHYHLVLQEDGTYKMVKDDSKLQKTLKYEDLPSLGRQMLLEYLSTLNMTNTPSIESLLMGNKCISFEQDGKRYSYLINVSFNQFN